MFGKLRGWISRERLVVAVVCSLLLHLCLLAGALLAKRFAPIVVLKKGEPLFVELPSPEEFAPRGNPALPVRPSPPPVPKARPSVPKPAPKALDRPLPPAPKPAPAATPLPRPPEPTREPAVVAKAPASPEPEGLRPSPPAPSAETAKPEPPAPAREESSRGQEPSGREPQVAALPQREPGGGGGLRGGRGGIEGEPIPLDTKDPRYTDYFEKIRRQIRGNWIYPREAGERGIGGQLVIEFVIAKDGHLQAIELRRSSGVEILDRFALNAVKLAQPFPRVPDAIAKAALPIAGIFTYQVLDPGLMNNFLR